MTQATNGHRKLPKQAGPARGLAALLLLSLAAAPLRADNFANISLNVTIVDFFGSFSLQAPAAVSSRDYLAVPLSVDAGDTEIEQATVFYSASLPLAAPGAAPSVAGATSFVSASGTQGFSPDPAGQKTYRGKALIPASAYLQSGRVYYYIKCRFKNGLELTRGTAQNPLSTEFVAQFRASLTSSGATIIFPDGDDTDGNTALVFPAGAIPLDSAQVSIEQLDQADRTRVPAGSAALAVSTVPVAAFEFNCDVNRFQKPVQMVLRYADVDDVPGRVDGANADESSLRVFWWDNTAWRQIGGVVDPVLNTVTAQTTHFSTFALFPVARMTPTHFRPLEKIVSPNGDGVNDIAYFPGMTGSFEVRIFDMTGERVRTLRDQAQWDGRDDGGRIVENGSYIYQYRTDMSNDWVSGVIGVAR